MCVCVYVNSKKVLVAAIISVSELKMWAKYSFECVWGGEFIKIRKQEKLFLWLLLPPKNYSGHQWNQRSERGNNANDMHAMLHVISTCG